MPITGGNLQLQDQATIIGSEGKYVFWVFELKIKEIRIMNSAITGMNKSRITKVLKS